MRPFSVRPVWLLVLLGAVTVAACAAPARPRPVTTPQASAPASLQGSSWVAVEIDNAGVLDRVRSTLAFQPDGRVAGSTGCNQYTAPVQAGEAVLRIGAAGVTRRACDGSIMDQELRFVTALSAVAAYRLEGSQLLLLDEAGRTRVRLVSASSVAAP
jgi:heat shock protein HslJ